MKNYQLLLLSFCCLSFSVQAQLFTPHQEAIDNLVTLLDKELDKDNLKYLRKQLHSSSIGKGYAGKKLLDGYLDKKKKLRLVAEAAGKLNYLSFTFDTYNTSLTDLFPFFEGKSLEEVGQEAEQKGWLEQVVYNPKLQSLYALLPSTPIVLKIDKSNSSTIYIEFSKERNVQASHKKLYADLVEKNNLCAKALVTPPLAGHLPTLPKGGTCLEGCQDPEGTQVWHYGNAIYKGKMKDGLPENHAKHLQIGRAALYWFDLEGCTADSKDLKNYQHWLGNYSKGKAIGQHYYSIKKEGQEKQQIVGTLQVEQGQLVRAKKLGYNATWEPVPLKEATYTYQGPLNQGKPTTGLVFHQERKLNYQLTFRNGQPDLSGPIKVYYSAAQSIKGKNTPASYQHSDTSNLYYFGYVDENWEPKGMGELHFISTKEPFVHQWYIRGNFLNKTKVVPNTEVVLLEETAGRFWRGKAKSLRFLGSIFDLNGTFNLYSTQDTTIYSQGEFVGTLNPKDSRVIFPMPVGKHQAYKIEKGVPQLTGEQFYSNKGLPMQLAYIYKYASYQAYLDKISTDYFKEADASTKEAFQKELLALLKKKYPKAHIYKYIDHISIPGEGGTATVRIYNFSTTQELQVGLRVKGSSEVIAARKLHPANPIEGCDGLIHKVNRTGQWLQLNRTPYVEEVYIVLE